MSVHLFGKWPGVHGFTAKAKFMQRKLVFATFWGSFVKVHGTGQVRGSQATGHSLLRIKNVYFVTKFFSYFMN